MDRDTFAKDLQSASAMLATDLDMTNDCMLVIDASQTKGRAKYRKMSPTELAKAVKTNEAQALRLALLGARNSDGSVLAAAAAAGKFGCSITAGTSSYLVSEVANANTKTDIAVFETVLPPNYVDGDAVTLTVNSHVSGTLTTKTIDASVYEIGDDDTHGADLVTTNAQAMTTAAAGYDFTVTPTSLAAGDRLLVLLTMVITEAAAANQTGRINSVKLSF